ncbi:MAG: hypothetical protein U0487_02780 [Patescibacteria group bacterium]
MTDPLQYKCYSCGHIGPESDFPPNEFGAHECSRKPDCGEDIFPHRVYECTGCGLVFDQNEMWPEYDLDQDPIAFNYEFVCDEYEDDNGHIKPGCGSKVFIPHTP